MIANWSSSTECDFCHKEAKEVSNFFIDGKTKAGPWALMCGNCFKIYGVGLGTGKGQTYSSITLQKLSG